ncbi:hypothetical protein [Motilimonas pumila]|uniref:Flagellar hook-length control protein FliK n=1 Tax=Motilimonas pumila TaxID=2303987 RepID=A0A418YE11_9GAMM|nr:hypothetical protein [Motilimonas pumila]RJG42790.1 hypothetical protein D1Z90_11920 [Motilimonas pumila]
MKQPTITTHLVSDPALAAAVSSKSNTAAPAKTGLNQAALSQDIHAFQQTLSTPLNPQAPSMAKPQYTSPLQAQDKSNHANEMMAGQMAEPMSAHNGGRTAAEWIANQPSAELLAPVLAKTGLTLPDSPAQVTGFIKQLDQLSANHQVSGKDVELLLQQMGLVMEVVAPTSSPSAPSLPAFEPMVTQGAAVTPEVVKNSTAMGPVSATVDAIKQAMLEMPLPPELKAAVEQISNHSPVRPEQLQQLTQTVQQLPVTPAQQHLVQKLLNDFVLPLAHMQSPASPQGQPLANAQVPLPASPQDQPLANAQVPLPASPQGQPLANAQVQSPMSPQGQPLANAQVQSPVSPQGQVSLQPTAATPTAEIDMAVKAHHKLELGNGPTPVAAASASLQEKPDSLEGLLSSKAILPTPETLLQQVMAQPKAQGAGLQQLSAEMIANIDIAKAKAGEEMTVKLAHPQFAGSEVNFKLENNVFVLTFTAKEPEHAQLAQLILPDLKHLLEEKFPQFKHDLTLQQDDEHESEWAQQQEQESQQDGQSPGPQDNEDELA